MVRPGYLRNEADIEASNVLVSAYQGDGKTVVILINPGNNPASNVSFSVSGETPSSATSFVTNLSSNRKKTELLSEDGLLLMNLLAKIVTTVVIED